MEVCNVCGRSFSEGAFCPDHPGEAARLDATAAIGDGARVFATNLVPFLAFWVVPTVIGTAISVMAAEAALRPRDARDYVADLRSVLYLFIGGVPSFLVTMMFAGGTAAMVKDGLDQRRVSVRSGLDAMTRRLPDLFWSAVILGVLFLLAVTVFLLPAIVFSVIGIEAMAAVFAILGALFAFMSVFVILHWFMFTPFVAALERVKPHRTLVESKLFAAKNRTGGFTVLLIIVGLVLAIANALTTDAISQGFPPDTRLTAREALSGVFLWVATPLLTVMAATLYIRMRTPTRLYEQLRPQVVTACPSCHAPMSYAPSEGPLRVKCGSCGREGILRPGRPS
ncbi:MAG: hypothetical protein HY556_10300 [Euryarchaeota archaeon]|nr:hypothetical protein [Euryarchaeota archaeon]